MCAFLQTNRFLSYSDCLERIVRLGGYFLEDGTIDQSELDHITELSKLFKVLAYEVDHVSLISLNPHITSSDENTSIRQKYNL